MLADARAVRAYQAQRFRDTGLLPERDHLIRRLYALSTERMPIYCHVLCQLGRWMVSRGWSLQQRFGAVSPPPLSQAANQPAN
jgi:hypothetical protein